VSLFLNGKGKTLVEGKDNGHRISGKTTGKREIFAELKTLIEYEKSDFDDF